MFKFNGFDNRQARMIMPEIMIKLVGLIDIVEALTETIIHAETWNNCTNNTSRIKACIREQQRKHGSGCTLAVYTTNGEHTLAVHKFPKHLLPCHDLYTMLARS